ncbi:MAG: hypothetical protein AAGF19_01860 [Pseudomonadota bacterium]
MSHGHRSQGAQIPPALNRVAGRPVNRLSQVMCQAADKAGVDKRLHDLRGTYATRLAAEGYSEAIIAEIMG